MAFKQSADASAACAWCVKSLSCLRQTRSTAVHSRSTAFDDWLAENPLPAQALSPSDRAAEKMAKEIHLPPQGLGNTLDSRGDVRADNSAGDCVFTEDNYSGESERADPGAESFASTPLDEIWGESILYSDMHSILRSLSLERDLVWDAKRSRFKTVRPSVRSWTHTIR